MIPRPAAPFPTRQSILRVARWLVPVIWVTAVLIAALAVPAGAMAVWVPPATDLSPPSDSSYNPKVAVGPDGSATAVWMTEDSAGDVTLHASHRTGNEWDGDTVIAGADIASVPSVVVDGDGVATVAWARITSGGDTVVEARRRTAAGWGATQVLATKTGIVATGVQLAVDGRGGVTAVYNDAPFAVFVSCVGGAWQQELSINLAFPSTFRVAQNAAGNLALTWSEGGAVHLLQYADGLPGAINPISGSGSAASVPPEVAIDANGTITVVWARSSGSGVEVAWSRAPWGSWAGPAAVLAAPGSSIDADPVVVADPTGAVTAAWSNSTLHATMAARLTGDAWSAPVQLGPSGDSYPALAVDARGTVTAAWTGEDDQGRVALRTSRFTAGAWGEAATLGSAGLRAGQQVDLAADVHGGVTAVWESPYDQVGAKYQVQSQQFASRPGPPTGVGAVAGSAAAAVSWVPPARTGGMPITSYAVIASDGRSGCTAAAPATSCTVTGLVNGTGYSFTVRATSAAGEGEASAPSATVVPGPPASAVLGATLLPSRTRLVSGQSMRLGIRVSNTGAAAAASARACVRLPGALVVARAPGAVRSGRTVCLPAGTVAAGTSVTRQLTVRASSARAVTQRIRGSASASGVAAVQAPARTVRIVPRHRAVRVTG